MEDNQQLKNKLSLLSETMKFYSDKDNYVKNQNNNTQSFVELDGGHIARHTLNIVGKIENFEMELEKLGQSLDEMDSPDEILNRVNEIIKNIE